VNLARRPAKLGAATVGGVTCGIVYHVDSQALISLPRMGKTLTEDDGRTRHPGASFAVKRLVDIPPDDD
jgi:hypothetical protein